MPADEKTERLEVALWHAGLKPEHRQDAVQLAGTFAQSATEAVGTLKGLHPEWFGTPRTTVHDAIGSATQRGVDYRAASREDRDRQAWSEAGIR